MNVPSFSRRDFLRTGAAALATASFPTRGLLAARAASYGGKTLPFGVQLWTVKDAFIADPESTLTKLAGLGFKGVEFYTAFPGGRDAKAMRAMLDRLGLKAI